MKSPLFRKVDTTRCSLNSCLPSSLELQMIQGAKTRPLIQKVSTGSGPTQATSSTSTTWFEKTDAQMDKYLEELMSKLWAALLKRAEEKFIDGILLAIGSCVMGVSFFCIFHLVSALGLDIGMKDKDKLSEGLDTEETSEAFKALHDILRRKDERALAYKKEVDILLKRNDALLKDNDTLWKNNDALWKCNETLLKNLVDIIEQHRAASEKAKEQGNESSEKRPFMNYDDTLLKNLVDIIEQHWAASEKAKEQGNESSEKNTH